MPQYKYPVSKGFKWLTKFNYVDPIDGKTKSKLKRGFDSKRDAKKFEEDFIESLTIPEENDEAIIKTVELQNSTQGIYCNKSGKEICPLVLR